MRGSCLPHAQFSLQYLKFSLRYTMGNMFGMFSFAFWVIRTLKCEAVNFLKFELAGIPVRYVPILIIAHVPCMHTHDTHAYHDITRFTYDVNHITMMSPVFAFHLCHVETRWHDIISVHIVRGFPYEGSVLKFIFEANPLIFHENSIQNVD